MLPQVASVSINIVNIGNIVNIVNIVNICNIVNIGNIGNIVNIVNIFQSQIFQLGNSKLIIAYNFHSNTQLLKLGILAMGSKS